MGRVQDALDRGEGLSDEGELSSALDEAGPEVRAEAEALGQIDAALRAWPQAALGEDAAEALASRIEQRLDEDLPRIDDPTEPPAFDDADAADAEGGAVVASADAPGADEEAQTSQKSQKSKDSTGDFSLANLTSLSVRDMPAVSPKAPLKRPPQKRRADATQPFDIAEAIAVKPVAPVQPPAPPPARAPKPLEPTGERASFPVPSSVDLGTEAQSAADLPPPPADLDERRHRNRKLFYVGSTFAAAAVAVLAFVTLESASPEADAVAVSAPASLATPTDMVSADMEEMAEGEASVAPVPSAAATGTNGIPADRVAAEPTVEAVAAAEAPAGGGHAAEGSMASMASAPVEAESVRRARRAPAADTPAGPAAQERPRMARGMASPAPVMATNVTPSRTEVTRVLRAIQPAVSACANGRTGIVTVNITVASSGRIRNAVVQGEFAGTRQGTCVARAVRRARFSPFQQDSFSVRYPFRL